MGIIGMTCPLHYCTPFAHASSVAKVAAERAFERPVCVRIAGTAAVAGVATAQHIAGETRLQVVVAVATVAAGNQLEEE